MTPQTETSSSTAQSDLQKEASNQLIISYLTLRNLIGLCGMLLPLILLATTSHTGTDPRVEPSISDYYYTNSGEVLVVVLSTLAVFLFTYQGYERGEKLWSSAAAVGALGVAFFPTQASDVARQAFSLHTPRHTVPQFFGLIDLHFVFAALFFVAAAIVALRYFTHLKPDQTERERGHLTQKGKRNRTYRICGWTILASVALIAIYFKLKPSGGHWDQIPVVFILESIAVEAFGIAWLTKGQTLWPDDKSYLFNL